MLSPDALRNVSILEEIEESLLKLLIVRSKVVAFESGEPLMTEGENGDSLHVLLEGRVGVERRSTSGETIRIAERGAGDCFGEMSLLDGEKRSATVVALEPCKVLVIRQDTFTQLILAHPRAALAIMQTLVRRLREETKELAESKAG